MCPWSPESDKPEGNYRLLRLARRKGTMNCLPIVCARANATTLSGLAQRRVHFEHSVTVTTAGVFVGEAQLTTGDVAGDSSMRPCMTAILGSLKRPIVVS